MSDLEARVRGQDGDGGEGEDEAARMLAEMTSCGGGLGGRRRELYGGDLEATAAVMRTLASRVQYMLQTRQGAAYAREAYVQTVFGDVLRAASHLLGGAEGNCRQRAWHDLGGDARRAAKAATAITMAAEEGAFLLAGLGQEDRYTEEATNEIGE